MRIAAVGRTLLAPGLCLAGLLAFAPGAGAQEPDAAERAQSEALLRERYRPAIHPDDPLRLSGREQNGNELRSRTPALANSRPAARAVDVEASRARALALYSERAHFAEAPGASGARAASAGVAAGASAGRAKPKPASPSSSAWPGLLAAGVLSLLAIWSLRRLRSS